MGCGGQKQSRARPASRTWRACRAFSIRTGRGLAGKLLNCRSPRVCNVFRFAAQSITGSIPVGPRGRRHPLHPQRPRRQDAGRGRTAAAFGSVCRCCQPVPGARDATRGVVFELRSQHLSQEVVDGPGASVFLARTESLVDGVLCVEEMLADLSDQAAWWDKDVARDCIRRLGGTPSPENVQRIVHVRWVAQRLVRDPT